jgi:hypothetical protein
MERNDEQQGVADGASATDHLTGEEIANGAADALHGGRANEEKYEQPDATVLPSSTLIADNAPGEPSGRRDA